LERLQDGAVSITGLDDFGWAEALVGAQTLCADYATESRLSLTGKRNAYSEIRRNLCDRLRLVDYRKRRVQSNYRFLVITGLPRTGSTLLHNLLSLVPGTYTPSLGDSLLPFPSSEAPEVRQANARRYLAFVDRLSPLIRQLHPMGINAPEECVTLMQSTFLSHKYELLARVPEYSEWFLSNDGAWAYEEYRDLVGLLAYKNGPGCSTVVLKAPAHLFHIQALLGAFSEVVIIQTHRRPVEALTSYADLVGACRTIQSDHVERGQVLRETFQGWAVGLERILEQRRSGGGRVIDVSFRQLIDDPLATLNSLTSAGVLPVQDQWLDEITKSLEGGLVEGMKAQGVRGVGLELDATDSGARTVIDEYSERFRDYL